MFQTGVNSLHGGSLQCNQKAITLSPCDIDGIISSLVTPFLAVQCCRVLGSPLDNIIDDFPPPCPIWYLIALFKQANRQWVSWSVMAFLFGHQLK